MKKTVEKLIKELLKLPSIGHKSAEKLTLQIINLPKEDSISLGETIIEVAKNLKECKICNNITFQETCSICNNLNRDKSILLIVANFPEINKFEETNSYQGYYHVLGGVINPLEGVGPSNLNINSLKKRLDSENISEIIMAFGLSTEAETTLYYLNEMLKEQYPKIKISRLAQGIPAGSEIEYLDNLTLKEALTFRKKIN